MTTRRSGPLKNVSNWVAPCKPALCDYFVAIFQVPQNRLKFGMSTPFVPKKVPVFFFQECRKIWTKLRQIQPLHPLSLCPPPNNVGFRYFKAKTLCVCLLHYWWGRMREGGVDFQECVWSLVSPLVKKMQGHFFTEEESACQISADSTWKIATK